MIFSLLNCAQTNSAIYEAYGWFVICHENTTSSPFLTAAYEKRIIRILKYAVQVPQAGAAGPSRGKSIKVRGRANADRPDCTTVLYAVYWSG